MADTTKAYNGILLPNFAGYDGPGATPADGKLDSRESALFMAEALAGNGSTAAIAGALSKHCGPNGKAALDAAIPDMLSMEGDEDQIARMALESTYKSLSPNAQDGLLEAYSFVTGELRDPGSHLNGHMSDGANLGEAALLSLSDKPMNTSNVGQATRIQLEALAPLLDDAHTQIAEAVSAWRAEQSTALPQGIDVPTSEQVCNNLRIDLKNADGNKNIKG